MLTRLLHRSVAAVNERLILLAPSRATLASTFENVDVDPSRHGKLIADMQRLRGSIYLRDGAIRPGQLTAGGRHKTPEDDSSWHLLMVDRVGGVDACAWYNEHLPTVSV